MNLELGKTGGKREGSELVRGKSACASEPPDPIPALMPHHSEAVRKLRVERRGLLSQLRKLAIWEVGGD